jgi:hypothetical protein
MDEMGHEEWADRQQKTCIVPVSHEAAQVHSPVSRCGKRVTLIACIVCDGSFLRPTIIIPRKTVDDDLLLTGLTSEKVTVASRAKGFIDTALFDAWLLDTFLPELQRRRRSSDYNGPSDLILDNCTAHSRETFTSLCQQNRVVPFYLPPHSSHLLQALDVSLFGITKRLLSRANRMEALNVQSGHIAGIVCSFMSATTPLNVIQTFRRAGITVVVDSGSLLCYVDPDRICSVYEASMTLVTQILDVADEGDGDDFDWKLYSEHCASLLYDLGPIPEETPIYSIVLNI